MNIITKYFWILICAFGILTGCSIPIAPVPGKAEAFEPLKAYKKVAHFAGRDAKLYSMSASGVGTNGTLNLKSKKPRAGVEYRFLVKASGSDAKRINKGFLGTRKVRKGRKLIKKGDLIAVWVSVGGVNYKKYNVTGMMRTPKRRPNKKTVDMVYLPEPVTTLAAICKNAVAKGHMKSGKQYVIRYQIQGYVISLGGKFNHAVYDDYGKLISARRPRRRALLFRKRRRQ